MTNATAKQHPTTVWGVFRARSGELAKGNSGAALAITLAFVMPVYLMVIGIYGVGEVVRNKIQLQNAADAAAYSAAVVQADYLSRMATVNKAMAWTYVDLQKRSLDLAMDTFCVTVFAKFASDQNMVVNNNRPCHMHVPGLHYNVGTDILVIDPVLLVAGTGTGVPLLAKKFNGQGLLARFLLDQSYHTVVANIKGKGTVTNLPKVLKYSYAIIKMTKKLADLREEYPDKVKEVAKQIAIANMMECKDDYYVKVHMGNPWESFFTMPGTEQYEETFIAFADPTLKSFKPKDVFGPGTDLWIKQQSPVGFWRVYKQTNDHLYAEWDWFWTRWVHFSWPVPPIELHLPPITPGGGYDHGHRQIRGTDDPLITNGLPVGLLVVPAVPFTLLPTFFAKSGAITVAIVRKTSNPLSIFSGSYFSQRSMTAPGILSAFNPSVAGGHRPEYMVAIASARAGYKTYNKDKSAKLSSSDYNLGYTLESKQREWNLVETDWDGVMLPVKYAWAECIGAGNAQTFANLGGGNILEEVILDRSGWVDSNGKDVDKSKLPEWEKLEPPGGLIQDRNNKNGNKLDWEKLRDYLGH